MTKSYWMDAMVGLMQFLFNCVRNLEALLYRGYFFANSMQQSYGIVIMPKKPIPPINMSI